jgi:hypothetical protein
MAETDPTDPTAIDRDTMLVGLTAIGIRLYADSGEALSDSILAAERVVFGRMVAAYDSRSRSSLPAPS